jgi:hypothetical protein
MQVRMTELRSFLVVMEPSDTNRGPSSAVQPIPLVGWNNRLAGHLRESLDSQAKKT